MNLDITLSPIFQKAKYTFLGNSAFFSSLPRLYGSFGYDNCVFSALLFCIQSIIRFHQQANLFVNPALHTNFKVTIIYPFYKFFLPNLWQFESLRVIKFELQSKFIFKLDIEILQSNKCTADSFRFKIKL